MDSNPIKGDFFRGVIIPKQHSLELNGDSSLAEQ
jgi:hypothetical protein